MCDIRSAAGNGSTSCIVPNQSRDRLGLGEGSHTLHYSTVCMYTVLRTRMYRVHDSLGTFFSSGRRPTPHLVPAPARPPATVCYVMCSDGRRRNILRQYPHAASDAPSKVPSAFKLEAARKPGVRTGTRVARMADTVRWRRRGGEYHEGHSPSPCQRFCSAHTEHALTPQATARPRASRPLARGRRRALGDTSR